MSKPLQKFNPLSHSIIALSSAYQEYNPLCIKTLHSLVLLNGVDCILTNRRNDQGGSERENSIKEEFHVLPLMKCLIVGIITYCHYKANGTVVLIVDDGSGHCDCIGWVDDEEMDRYQVGNLVKIQAAIKILSLADKRTVKVEEKLYTGWTCVRELRVHSIHMVLERNEEIIHWLHCLQFIKRIGMQVTDSVNVGVGVGVDRLNDADFQKQIMKIPVLNGLETFRLLPKKEQQLILASSSMEDSFIEMDDVDRLYVKYYGRDCKCEMKYKDVLLYCHCLATRETLDPQLLFRDTLLNKLVATESSLERNKVDTGDDAKKMRSLEFYYNSIYDDAELQTLATDVIQHTKDPEINLRRLYTNTFKHLRNDGVLCLLDVDADIYLLMSKDRVLMPAILQLEIENGHWEYQLKITGKAPTDAPPSLPKFLQIGISSSKLRLVKNLVTKMRRVQSTKV
eukprot:scaffold2153_cov271-Chaetoceros_neogracile.AAC.23